MTGTLKARVNGAWDKVVYAGDPAGTAEAHHWNSAWGVVGDAPMVGQSGVQVAANTLTPVSTTLTARLTAGRRYVLRGSVRALAPVGAAGFAFLRISGTGIVGHDIYTYVQASYTSLKIDYPYTSPSDQIGTWTLNLQANAAIYVYAEQAVSYFYIEDIGPVTGATVQPTNLVTTAPGNALGVIATANQVAATVDVAYPVTTPGTNLTVPLTATLQVGRRYRATFRVAAANAIGGTPVGANVCIYDSGNVNIGDSDQWFLVAGAYAGVILTAYFDGDGTTKTLRATLNSISAAGTIRVYPKSLVLEDVGPNTSPALAVPATPPAWTALPFANGWTQRSGQALCRYRKIGDVVYVEGGVLAPSGLGTSSVVGTLPVGFRPPQLIQFGTAFYNQGTSIPSGLLGVGTNGGISISLGTPAIAAGGDGPINCSFSTTP